MREEGKLCSVSTLFFSPGSVSNAHCKNRQKHNLSETTQVSERMGKELKDRESQLKLNSISRSLMKTWA